MFDTRDRRMKYFANILFAFSLEAAAQLNGRTQPSLGSRDNSLPSSGYRPATAI